jgi:hypothetical protein
MAEQLPLKEVSFAGKFAVVRIVCALFGGIYSSNCSYSGSCVTVVVQVAVLVRLSYTLGSTDKGGVVAVPGR